MKKQAIMEFKNHKNTSIVYYDYNYQNNNSENQIEKLIKNNPEFAKKVTLHGSHAIHHFRDLELRGKALIYGNIDNLKLTYKLK